MDLWSVARYDLHLSDAEFWALTPRQFDALARRHRAAAEQADLRAGLVASVIANVHRDRKRRSRPYTPGDFVGSRGPERRSGPGWQRQLKLVEMWNAAMNGRDLRKKGVPGNG